MYDIAIGMRMNFSLTKMCLNKKRFRDFCDSRSFVFCSSGHEPEYFLMSRAQLPDILKCKASLLKCSELSSFLTDSITFRTQNLQVSKDNILLCIQST